MLHSAQCNAGLQQSDVPGPTPPTPSHSSPVALVTHVKRKLDEVTVGGPHAFQLAALPDLGPDKSVVRTVVTKSHIAERA